MIKDILGIICVAAAVGSLVALTIFAIKHEETNVGYRNRMYKAITKYFEEKNKK